MNWLNSDGEIDSDPEGMYDAKAQVMERETKPVQEEPTLKRKQCSDSSGEEPVEVSNKRAKPDEATVYSLKTERIARTGRQTRVRATQTTTKDKSQLVPKAVLYVRIVVGCVDPNQG